MMDIICNCGHAMSEHEVVYGCLYELEDGAICHCGNEPTYIANDKLAALLAAGNALAERMKGFKLLQENLQEEADLDGVVKILLYHLHDGRDAAALAAWEKVTK
jgi:hypothetical protein